MDKGYQTRLAAAWVRGELANRFPNDPTFSKSLQDLTPAEQQQLVRLGKQEGLTADFLRLHAPEEPVRKLLHVLGAVQADHVLDMSAQEGDPYFLWLLLRSFPYLPIMEIEIKNRWIDRIKAMHRGGIQQLDTQSANPVRMTAFMSNQFDVVTSTYALNHVSEPEAVFSEMLRLSKRYTLLLINQEVGTNEIEFTKEKIKSMGEEKQLLQLKIEEVEGSWLVIARQ